MRPDQPQPAMATVSAPGKVMVVGAYLVVEPPYEALVLATSARFYASVAADRASDALSSCDGRECLDIHDERRLPVRILSPQLRSSYILHLSLPSCEVMEDYGESRYNQCGNGVDWQLVAPWTFL